MKCNICPRECGADRESSMGFCGVPNRFVIARAALHFWEEPPISGTGGSGAVFFSGCHLGCVYCQNYQLSHCAYGTEVSDSRLGEIFHELADQGAHNINLVNPTHYAVGLRRVLSKEKPQIPVVYNSSGYEKVQTLRTLEGLADVYLPDLKYIDSARSEKYSAAADYFDYAAKALQEMKRQCPENIYDGDGLIQRGLIVRHLVLPKNTNQSLKILDWIKENLGLDTAVSLMSQYTPCGELENTPELRRRITRREYEKVVNYAEELGFETIFTQQLTSAEKKFIPDFDLTGI
ncbi:MAG: 4Fe-4S cluster-binding domain-containing protein [Oscillospiraceae bacterium]|nr:4Fe-4S cluster-binding domain-containing protein [Oscillospiraceae bacterium]